MSTQRESSTTAEAASFPHLPGLPFPRIPQIALINCDDTKQEFIDKFGTVPQLFYNLLRHYLGSFFPLPGKNFGDGVASQNGLSKEDEEIIKKRGIPLDPLKWFGFHRFDAQKGQLPKLNGSVKYDCIILSGSSSSVNDEDNWIYGLSDLIYEVAIGHPDIRLVGVCFGHQLLCKVLYAPSVHIGPGVWEIGPYAVQLNGTGASLFGGLGTLNLEMFHAEAVFTKSFEIHFQHLREKIAAHFELSGDSVKQGASILKPPMNPFQPTVWGSTEGTACQGTVVFYHEGHGLDYLGQPLGRRGDARVRVLTMQGHPELTQDMAKLLLDLFSKPGEGKEAIPPDVAEEARIRIASWKGTLDWVRVTRAIWAVASGTSFNDMRLLLLHRPGQK